MLIHFPMIRKRGISSLL
ncbi:hypothetical protein CFP56_010220 [Quercus suber]|uniref:Uncharacterized protein n=1 Tax=Quercus suber TaxID=58331 RepID=A0AAW0KZU6_QUESU